MDYALAKIERDYRIHVAKALLNSANWVPGNDDGACVLLAGAGRCRLLQGNEVQNEPRCVRLREQIQAASEEALTDILSFRDESVDALPLRLLPVEMTPHGVYYRLTLPRILTGIFQVRPGVDSVAVLVNQGHIEIWSLETLRAAVAPRFEELL